VGLVSDSNGTVALLSSCCAGGVGVVNTAVPIGAITVVAPFGGWFYRNDVVVGVPAPATLALIGLGLVGLAWSRHRKQ